MEEVSQMGFRGLVCACNLIEPNSKGCYEPGRHGLFRISVSCEYNEPGMVLRHSLV